MRSKWVLLSVVVALVASGRWLLRRSAERFDAAVASAFDAHLVVGSALPDPTEA